MKCPDEIAEVLLEMLSTGLFRARNLGWAGRPDLCAIEADHLHNLPDLIRDFSEARLAYYWVVERPSFAEQLEDVDIKDHWEPHWDKLRPYAESSRTSATAR